MFCDRRFVNPIKVNSFAYLFDTGLERTGHMLCIVVGWLVGCFGLNGPLRQYFSLHRAVFQRERQKEKSLTREKISKQPPPAPTASTEGPCPTLSKLVGRPGAGSLPSTIAPPDHPPLYTGHIFVRFNDLEDVFT